MASRTQTEDGSLLRVPQEVPAAHMTASLRPSGSHAIRSAGWHLELPVAAKAAMKTSRPVDSRGTMGTSLRCPTQWGRIIIANCHGIIHNAACLHSLSPHQSKLSLHWYHADYDPSSMTSTASSSKIGSPMQAPNRAPLPPSLDEAALKLEAGQRNVNPLEEEREEELEDR